MGLYTLLGRCPGLTVWLRCVEPEAPTITQLSFLFQHRHLCRDDHFPGAHPYSQLVKYAIVVACLVEISDDQLSGDRHGT